MALKENVNLSRQEAENIVNVFFQSIEDSLGNGGRVEIRGFGSFTVNGYKSYGIHDFLFVAKGRWQVMDGFIDQVFDHLTGHRPVGEVTDGPSLVKPLVI